MRTRKTLYIGGLALWLLVVTVATYALSTAAPVTYRVHSGGDLQLVLDAAHPGDIIQLDPRAVFSGNFRLPAKAGNAPITLTTYATLQSKVRTSPVRAYQFARIVTTNGLPAITALPGSHGWRIVNLDISAANYSDTIIALGLGDEATLGDIPSGFLISGDYIHGSPMGGSKRGVGLNAVNVIVENSYISDIKSTFQDAQALCGWNSPGPFLIVNNYLEASGENVMFGGAIPAYRAIPSNITIRGNLISKPLAWRGGPWIIKNLFELKDASHVTLEGNILENNWAQAQIGWAIVLTVRGSDSGVPYARVQDVLIRDNWIRNAAQGITLLGRDGPTAALPCPGDDRGCRFTLENNLWSNINADQMGPIGGPGMLFLVAENPNDLRIVHNTVQITGRNLPLFFSGAPTDRVVFSFNAFTSGGISGNDVFGPATLTQYAPTAVLTGNVFPMVTGDGYPAGNFFPADRLQFTDPARGNFRLLAPLGTAGIDQDRLDAALAGVQEGTAQ